MTPGARVAAAIAVLDQMNDGMPAEKALTAWARGSRFAGSKDRAAVRDHVFDVWRGRRSLGAGSGRALMLRLARREGWSLDDLFSGQGHAPTGLTEDERTALSEPLSLSEAARHDIPDWLWPAWQSSLGDDAQAVALTLQGRAGVFLRVNQRRGSAEDAQASLLAEGIATTPHPHVKNCLRVSENARRIKLAQAYLNGLIELQDASSQRAVQAVPLTSDDRVLDYCAGGGGKALAFADRDLAAVFAYDIAPQRMRDLPDRAARAGVNVTSLETDVLEDHGPFDVVFCDAPCSGSGTWRRAPDAKWQLTETDLQDLIQSQREVISDGARLVKPEGFLVYATCSVLFGENRGIIAEFLSKSTEYTVVSEHQSIANQDNDGFYYAVMRKNNTT